MSRITPEGLLELDKLVPSGYKFVKELGKGTYGLVRSYITPARDLVAVKFLYNPDPSAGVPTDIVSELRTYNVLRNFSSVIGSIRFNNIYIGDAILTMIETNIQNEDLHSYLKKNNDRQRVKAAIDCLQQTVRTLYTFYTNGFLHLDIKPANILVGTDYNSDIRYLMSDFGLTTFHTPGMIHDISNAYTHGFRPPESVDSRYQDNDRSKKRLFTGSHKFDDKADVWALGATILYVLTGKYIFREDKIDRENYYDNGGNERLYQATVQERTSLSDSFINFDVKEWIESRTTAYDDIPKSLIEVLQLMVNVRPSDRIDIVSLDRLVNLEDPEVSINCGSNLSVWYERQTSISITEYTKAVRSIYKDLGSSYTSKFFTILYHCYIT
jgi:serine/threonine protein kinase